MCVLRSAHNLAKKLGVDAPIIEGIHRVIHEGADPKAVCIEVRCWFCGNLFAAASLADDD